MVREPTNTGEERLGKELHEHAEAAKEHVEATVQKTRHATQSAARKARKLATETVEKTREVAGIAAKKAKDKPRESMESVTQHTEKVAQKVQEHTETAMKHVAGTVEKVRGVAHSTAEKTQDLTTEAAAKTREVVTVVAEKAKTEARTGVLRLQILDLNKRRRQTFTGLGGRLYHLIKEKKEDAYSDDTVKELLHRADELDRRIAEADDEIRRLSERKPVEEQRATTDDEGTENHEPSSRNTSSRPTRTPHKDSGKASSPKRRAKKAK